MGCESHLNSSVCARWLSFPAVCVRVAATANVPARQFKNLQRHFYTACNLGSYCRNRNTLSSQTTYYKPAGSWGRDQAGRFFSLHLPEWCFQTGTRNLTVLCQDAELTPLPRSQWKTHHISHAWYEMAECEWPKCVHNSQDLGRHSVNTKPNDFLAHFYEPRRRCKDWMKISSIPLNAQADLLPLRK